MSRFTLEEAAERLTDKVAKSKDDLLRELNDGKNALLDGVKDNSQKLGELHDAHRDTVRRELLARMLAAAKSGELVVREPKTNLPRTGADLAKVRTFYDVSTEADIDAWLEEIDAGYRLKAGKDKQGPITKQWIWKRADAVWEREGGKKLRLEQIVQEVRRDLDARGITGRGGTSLTNSNIYRRLKGWKKDRKHR